MRNKNLEVCSNEQINPEKVKSAYQIISKMQQELMEYIANGSGPFLAALYDSDNNLIAKEANSVIRESCSHNHAEMNTIRAAEKKLGTYDLSPYHLKLYVTAEPCMMCLGGILWSGIKEVYYGVPSKRVEQITGFDEGFKPRWFDEFKKRDITVYGNIAVAEGEQALTEYMNQGKTIYKPQQR